MTDRPASHPLVAAGSGVVAAGSGVVAAGTGDVALAAALWGTAGTVQERLLPTVAPLSVAGTRCLLAGAVLVLVLVVRPARRAALVATVRGGGRPLLAATAAMTLFQAGYLLGIRTVGVAVGTLVALGSAPVWAGLLAAVAGRAPGRRWLVGTTLAVVGLTVLVGTGGTRVTAVGLLPSLAAGFGYGAYTTASARLGAHDRSAVVAIVFTVCGLVLVPAALADPVPATVTGLAAVAWLVLGTTVVAYLRFLRGLRHLEAPAATTLSLLEPLTATVLAVVVVGERVPPIGLVGTALLLIGVALAGRPPRPRPGDLASAVRDEEERR